MSIKILLNKQYFYFYDFRPAKHLGFSSIKELKTYIVDQQESPANKMISIMSHAHTLDAYMKKQNEFFLKSMEHFDENQFSTLAKDIAHRDTIDIYAKGTSLSLADYLLFRLRRFGKKVILISKSGSEIFEDLNTVKEEDFMIVFGFQKTPIKAKVILDYCKKCNTPTLFLQVAY